jgi:DNA-directed RNA polymerase specialized sigma24 family protein
VEVDLIGERVGPVSTGRVDVDATFGQVRARLVRIATGLVGAEAAEDVVHDTYLVARDRIGQLRDPLAAEAWLARICVHRCFRVRRRRLHLERLLPRLVSPPVRPPDLDLRGLIEALPPRERAVLVLHHGHGYTLAEVGELVGISHANARAIASRAQRRLLREWLEASR